MLCTILVVDGDGEPSYISIPGASKHLTTGHVNNAKHVIQQCKVLVSNNGIAVPTALEGLKLGKHYGAITIYNPAPRIYELPDELYKNTDILMLNMHEATALTKTKVSGQPEAENACVWFHAKGVPCVVLTVGKNGAIVSLNKMDVCQGKGKCFLLLMIICLMLGPRFQLF